jgi:hypothetical protein
MKICNCPICGLPWSEAIEQEEARCSFEICDCCGCEYGYDDYPKYREEWIRKGAPWFDPKERPLNWNLEEQLKYVTAAWNVYR